MPDNAAAMQTANSEQPNSYPLISVLVPVYKTEKYLAQCVNSILTQTYPNIELILVDDGSPDNCPAMCDEYARNDSRVKVIHKENGGLGSARNAGLDAAKGEFIGIVDSDDYISPDMYTKLYGLMREYDCDMAMCVGIYGNYESLHAWPEIITGYEALRRIITPHSLPGLLSVEYGVSWNKLYSTELFKDVRYPTNTRHEDTARIHRLLGGSRKIVITHEKLYFQSTREDSITGRIRKKVFRYDVHMKHFTDIADALKDREQYLRERGMNDAADFEHLKTPYSVMILMLDKLNCIQYRKEIRNITGYTPVRLIIKLLTSKFSHLRLRALKLALLWVKSLFRPFVR